MNVTFQLTAQLRQLAGTESVQVAVATGATLATAIQNLAEHAPSLQGYLISETGIRRSLIISVNDTPVHAAQAESHVLTDGAEIVLLPPISGG